MKNSSAYKSKLAILALGVLFILTTLLGLSLYTPHAAYAASDYNLRFKQIALGGDFAIAIDYDGGLYGWSLTANRPDSFGTWDTDSKTLGDYYPSIPTKIDFGTSVKMIAATRYNAALITTAGKVYTWGSVQQKNASAPGGGYSSHPLMHLRTSSTAYPFNQPGEVDVSFYTLNQNANGLATVFTKEVTEIYGAEENFLIKNVEGKVGGWGSNLFGQLASSDEYNYGVSENDGLLTDFTSKWSGASYSAQSGDINNAELYIGKDFVLASIDGKLYLSGKNFYLNAGNADSTRNSLSSFNSFGVTYAVNTTTYKNATRDVGLEFQSNTFGKVTRGASGAFAEINAASTVVSNAVALKNANGGVVNTVAKNQTVAAGAGFIYYIAMNNNGTANDTSDDYSELKMLGNGYANQAGNGIITPTNKTHYGAAQTVGSLRNIVQVVAGRNQSDAGHIVGTGSGSKLYSFKETAYDASDANASQEIGTGTATEIATIDAKYADFSSDTPYISAALTADGSVYVWNASKDVTDLSQVLNPLLRGSEEIATLSGGYGYNLYALTNSGKLIQIKYDPSGAGIFTAKYHNTFNSASVTSGTSLTAIQGWMTESEYITTIHNPQYPTDFNSRLDERRTVHFSKTAPGYWAKVGINGTSVSDAQNVQVGRLRREGGNYGTTYNHESTASFIGQNNTADALGFLLDGTRDAGYFVTAPAAGSFVVPADSVFHNNLTTGAAPVWQGTDASIKFYYDYDSAKTLIEPDIIAQHFDFKIEVQPSGTKNVADDIQFSFVPKKSTKGNTITMEFLIGRYNNSQEYDSTTPVVYERKIAAIDIVIDATSGTSNQFSQQFAGVIPILDVNGTLNKQYSVAAMDVSTGFEQLGKALADLTSAGTLTQNSFVDKVHASLTGGADAGFPSATYAAELSYYDENNVSYYNSRYRYFAESSDGNLWYFTENGTRIDTASTYADSSNYVSATRSMVSVKVDLKTLLDIASTSEWNTELADTTSDAYQIKHYIDSGKFNNQYGFFAVTDVNPAEGDTLVSGIQLDSATGVLTLSYQIVTFRALAMATDTAVYNANQEINKPILERANKASFLNYQVRMRQYREVQGRVRYYGDATWLTDQYITVHTTASLKLKSNVIVGSASGQPGNNVARYNGSPNDALKQGVWTVTIGEQSSYKVRLIDLMEMNALETSGYVFKFAYGNEAVNTAGYYDGFTKSFNQSIIDPSKTYLTENELSFFFLESTKTSFSINIIKTATNGAPFHISESPGTLVQAEQIELQFAVQAELTKGIVKKQDAPSKISVSDTVTMSVSDFITEGNVAPEFIQFSSAVISNTAKATVEIAKSDDLTLNNRSVTIRAVASGVTYLRYTILLLGRHAYSGEVQLEVKYISDYRTEANPLSIMSREQIDLSDLATFLQGVNIHLGLTTLSIDREAGNNGYGEANGGITVQHKATSQTTWQTVPVSETPYIQSVSIEANDKVNIENGAHLLIILKSVEQGANIGMSRILVHFSTETTEGKVELIASIVVTPGHTDLVVNVAGEDGNSIGTLPLVVDVQYKDGYQSNLAATLQAYETPSYGDDAQGEKVLSIPIAYFFSEYLTGKQAGAGGRDYDSYAITHANIADSRVSAKDAIKYLTCDPANNGKNLEIRPIYPTAEIAANNPDTIDGVRVTLDFMSLSQQGGSDSFQVSFYIRVSQIKMTLTQQEWITAFIIGGAIVFGFLFIILFIRFIVYLRRKAEQKRIIKKNQMLIRMRDKMHHSSSTPNRSQAVKAKMKINDPKYAKMFDEMRKDKEAETGITLENSALAQKAENTSKTMDRVKASKKSKKKGSKKSIDDLKAELEAKRSALAQMQVPSGGAHVAGGDISMDSSMIDDASMFDSAGRYNAELSREDVEDQIKAKLEEGGFVEFEPLVGDDDML